MPGQLHTCVELHSLVGTKLLTDQGSAGPVSGFQDFPCSLDLYKLFLELDGNKELGPAAEERA